MLCVTPSFEHVLLPRAVDWRAGGSGAREEARGGAYLAPKRTPDVATLDLPLAQLARKWLLRGVFGRNTRKAAERALDAAEQLDLNRVLVKRREAD